MKVRDDTEALFCLRVASSSSNLLLFLVNDTLDFFQIKSGKFKIKSIPSNLYKVIMSCFELIQI
jgi:hypothetical protein